MGAGLAALTATLAAIPSTAYFTLTASPAKWIFFLALAASVVLATLAVRRVAQGHVREPFIAAVCTPIVVGTIGTLFAAVYIWLAFSLLRLPAYVEASSLAEALSQANRTLPSRHHPGAEMLALFRSAEAASWWTMNRFQGFGSSGSLFLFLLLKTFICYGLAKVIADITTFVSGLIDLAEHENEHFGKRSAGRQ